RLKILRPAEQSRLAFFADAAFEHRLDEYRTVSINEGLDLLFAGARTEDLGRGKTDELQQLRPVEHSGDLHEASSSQRLRASLPTRAESLRADSLRRGKGHVTAIHFEEATEVHSIVDAAELVAPSTTYRRLAEHLIDRVVH